MGFFKTTSGKILNKEGESKQTAGREEPVRTKPDHTEVKPKVTDKQQEVKKDDKAKQ